MHPHRLVDIETLIVSREDILRDNIQAQIQIGGGDHLPLSTTIADNRPAREDEATVVLPANSNIKAQANTDREEGARQGSRVVSLPHQGRSHKHT